jgi:hypothetical protein
MIRKTYLLVFEGPQQANLDEANRLTCKAADTALGHQLHVQASKT